MNISRRYATAPRVNSTCATGAVQVQFTTVIYDGRIGVLMEVPAEVSERLITAVLRAAGARGLGK